MVATNPITFVPTMQFIYTLSQVWSLPRTPCASSSVLQTILGAPLWGTHKKMTETDEQEWRELMQLKHHSHGLKNQHLGWFSLFRDQVLDQFSSAGTLLDSTPRIEPLIEICWTLLICEAFTATKSSTAMFQRIKHCRRELWSTAARIGFRLILGIRKCPLRENGPHLCGCLDGHHRTLTIKHSNFWILWRDLTTVCVLLGWVPFLATP